MHAGVYDQHSAHHRASHLSGLDYLGFQGVRIMVFVSLRCLCRAPSGYAYQSLILEFCFRLYYFISYMFLRRLSLQYIGLNSEALNLK